MREIKNYLGEQKTGSENNERSLRFLLSCYPEEKGRDILSSEKKKNQSFYKKFPLNKKSKFNKKNLKMDRFDEIKKHYDSERSYEKKINLLEDELERINLIFTKKEHKDVQSELLRLYDKKEKKKEKIYLEPITLEKRKTVRKNFFAESPRTNFFPRTNPNTIYLRGFKLS